MSRFTAGILLILILYLVGCAPRDTSLPGSVTSGLAKYPGEKNVALYFAAGTTAENNYEPYIAQDLVTLKRIFGNPKANFNLEVLESKSKSTTNDVLEGIKKYAPKVGYFGTLVVFLGSHGNFYVANDGKVYSLWEGDTGSTISAAHVINAVLEGRASRPFQRLVIIVATCHSGSWIDELNHTSIDHSMIREVVVMAGVPRGVTGLLGPDGSSFIYGFGKAFDELIEKKDSPPSIQDMVTLTSRYSKEKDDAYNVFFKKYYKEQRFDYAPPPPGDRSTQVRAYPSNDILKEPFFNTETEKPPVQYYLGINYGENALDKTPGVMVTNFLGVSAAREAGIQAGDLITSVDKTSITKQDDLYPKILSIDHPDVEIVVQRPSAKGDRWEWTPKTIPVRLKNVREVFDQGAAPTGTTTFDLGARLKQAAFWDGTGKGFWGLEIKDFNDTDSAAEARGLRKGDIVYYVNGVRVQTLQDYKRAVANHASVIISLSLKRGNRYLTKSVLGLRQ